MSGLLSYNTPLTSEEAKKYSIWAGPRSRDTQDYDLQGYWLTRATDKPIAQGHLSDLFKKPNHPTFSNESVYSTPGNEGGQWIDDGNGGWIFAATPANLKYRNVRGLLDYFQQQEPNSKVIYPWPSSVEGFLP